MLDWNKNYLNMNVGPVGVADLTNLIYRENWSGSLAMKNLGFEQKRKKTLLIAHYSPDICKLAL